MSWLFGSNENIENRFNVPNPAPPWQEVIRRNSPYSAAALNPDQALGHSTVYACVDLLADIVSTMPVQRFKKSANVLHDPIGAQRVRQDFDPNSVVDNPSDEQTVDAVNWRRLLMVMWMMRGFAPGIVTSVDPRNSKTPKSIELVHPDRISWTRNHVDAPWRFFLDENEMKLWPRGRLWIANGKMMSPSDPVGRSILEFAMAEVNLGFHARQFASEFFQGGGHPTAILRNEKKVSDMGLEEEGAKRVKSRFMDALRGGREPVVMTDGWQYERIQIRPDESQFLSTINQNRLIICNFFKIPPSLFGISAEGSGGNIVYGNTAERGLDVLKFTVQPWITRMESVLTPLTVRTEDVKLNVDSLLRADTKRRYDAHAIGIKKGWLSVNEIREQEDLPLIKGGNQFLWPPDRANMTLEEMAGDPDQGFNTPVTPPTLLPSPTDPNKVDVLKPVEEEANA